MATAFKSVHHPNDTPRGLVFTRVLARPLGVCTIPIMIGATASALQGQPIWSYVAWGLPAAILIATLWAHFTLRRTVAEIRLRPGQAAVRSVQDVLRNHPPQWHPLFKVRATSWYLEVSLGWETYELHPQQWPDYEGLQNAARQAFHPDDTSSVQPPSYA